MREIILSQKKERDTLLAGSYIPREKLREAKKYLNKDLIKVIVGPRRAGKSVFAIELLNGLNFAYINFDDERLLYIKDYDEILKGIKAVYGDVKYILFDEIQNIPRWEVFVNRLQRRGYNVVITGSNSRLLSKELATHLTGRYIQYTLYPFSFYEFLLAEGIEAKESELYGEDEGRILNLLSRYLTTGGYPEVVVKKIDPGDYLKLLLESVIFKDVVKRYNLRYSRKMYELVLYLVTNHSREISYTRLKNSLGFRSVHTVENYTYYLREAFLIFEVKRFSYKFKEQLRSPKKVYMIDTGIMEAFKFKVSQDIGRIMENLVAIELLRREVEFYYYKEAREYEIDFLVKEGPKVKELIQVCYNIERPEVRKRELRSLVRASDHLSCENLVVLTWDYEGEEEYKGKIIKFKPLWKWTLFYH